MGLFHWHFGAVVFRPMFVEIHAHKPERLTIFVRS